MGFNAVPFHGKVARVRKDTTNIAFSCDWSMNVQLDMADASNQGEDWKKALPGQGGWSGAMTFHFAAGNTEQKALMDNIVNAIPGTKLTDIKFVLDAQANQFTGDIFITSMAVKTDRGATVDVSFNYQGDGALNLTSAGT